MTETRLHVALTALVAAAVLSSVALLGLTADASDATTHWGAVRGDLTAGRAAAIAVGSVCLASIAIFVRSLMRQLMATRRALAALECRPGGRDGTVLFADARPVAFCAGLWRPRVYLSEGALTALEPAALGAVLEHERHHAVRRDPLRLLLVRAATDALFIAPALPRLAERYGTLLELDADARAVRASGGDAAPLARALLTFDERSDSGGVDPARVDHLLGTPGDRRLPITALTTSVMAAAGLLLATLSAIEFGGVLEFCMPLARHACFVLLDAAPLIAGAAIVIRLRGMLAGWRLQRPGRP